MSILIEHVTKRYAGQPVVSDASVDVQDGEFFVLLGPSGSGKSTLLRMIAGLTEVDTGRIVLHGRDVTRASPQERGVGFVFQNYALFRHMTVAENIEFPLRVRGASPVDRRQRREELLELVGLTGLGERRPTQLSGGQQQRVALARALAHKPEVLLLDEPFGALDTKIRLELRRAVRAIQRELGMTTIFVTHDQEEAFELADRLAVLDGGRLLEVGTPQELYFHPKTEFVALFLGGANLLVGETTPSGVRLGPVEMPLKSERPVAAVPQRVQVLIRPEDIAVKDEVTALNWPQLGKGIVEKSDFSGAFQRLRVRLPPLGDVRSISPAAPFGGDYLVVEAVRSQHQARRFPLHPGDETWVGVRRFHALAHPGMHFLVLAGPDARDEAAVGFAALLAQRAHARLSVLTHGAQDANGQVFVDKARAIVGAAGQINAHHTPEDLEVALAEHAAREPADLVVAAFDPRDGVGAVENMLACGPHHLLLVPRPALIPENILVCVAAGEPGKADVAFTGRLARHLGTHATIFTALDVREGDTLARGQAERFQEAAQRTLGRSGVVAECRLRLGQALIAITAELQRNEHQMLVVGCPLATEGGKPQLDGLVAQLLLANQIPTLIVRSAIASA